MESAQEQCEATLKAKADVSPESVKKMLDRFGEFKVTKEMLEGRIQRKLEAITAAQIISLRKIYNSLKDGMSKVDDWFEQAMSIVEEPKKERKPRSDKGQKRDLIQEKEPPTPEEYQPHTKEILSPDPIKPFSVLIDPETQAEIREYCARLGLDPDKEAVKYSANKDAKVSMLLHEEAGKMLGALLDLVAEKDSA